MANGSFRGVLAEPFWAHRFFRRGTKAEPLKCAAFVHAIGQAGAGGADIRIARERVSLLGHRLTATSADTGVHGILRGRAALINTTAGQHGKEDGNRT